MRRFMLHLTTMQELLIEAESEFDVWADFWEREQAASSSVSVLGMRCALLAEQMLLIDMAQLAGAVTRARQCVQRSLGVMPGRVPLSEEERDEPLTQSAQELISAAHQVVARLIAMANVRNETLEVPTYFAPPQ